MAVRKVLVCDDSGTDLARLSAVVSDAGVDVVTARDGAEAIAKAELERPDLIFLDILMPDMDGFEACRMLGRNPLTKDIPVVFVSSKGQRADRVWAQMQGGRGLVSKPYAAADIRAELAKY